jgi:hypothetical protein
MWHKKETTLTSTVPLALTPLTHPSLWSFQVEKLNFANSFFLIHSQQLKLAFLDIEGKSFSHFVNSQEEFISNDPWIWKINPIYFHLCFKEEKKGVRKTRRKFHLFYYSTNTHQSSLLQIIIVFFMINQQRLKLSVEASN